MSKLIILIEKNSDGTLYYAHTYGISIVIDNIYSAGVTPDSAKNSLIEILQFKLKNNKIDKAEMLFQSITETDDIHVVNIEFLSEGEIMVL